jgi:Flp pilus assembly protein TadG
MNLKQNKRKERGVGLILGSAALIFIIPAVGLAIDVGYLYAIRSKLQAAVDGAALAAARGLSLGQTTNAQASSAKQKAVNWFYANLPANDWATKNTQMDTTDTHVRVFDDPTNPQVRNVTVTASTSAPTWFMRWFGMDTTVVSASGNASRRDVVAMLVLDRSGSMGSACSALITAAKQFTGQFAAGRDQIGLITFSDGIAPVIAPSTAFQTTLGYTNSTGSSNGSLDTIKCNGRTGTPEAISMAYNELYKKSLPGALNLLVVETDGLPNTLVYNWQAGNTYGISASSGCQDANLRTAAGGGWTNGSGRLWFAGQSMNSGAPGYMADIPAGAIGAFNAADPPSQSFSVLYNPIQTSDANSNNSVTITGTAPGCRFGSGASGNISDFAWLPSADVYGNSVAPVGAYKPVTLTNGRIAVTGNTTTDWTNAHNAALNATDNSAYRARTNANLPVYVFTVGFTSSVDDVLLQRMANDPSWLTDPACVNSGACVNDQTQPQGKYVFAANTQELTQAFMSLASQALRLSK